MICSIVNRQCSQKKLSSVLLYIQLIKWDKASKIAPKALRTWREELSGKTWWVWGDVSASWIWNKGVVVWVALEERVQIALILPKPVTSFYSCKTRRIYSLMWGWTRTSTTLIMIARYASKPSFLRKMFTAATLTTHLALSLLSPTKTNRAESSSKLAFRKDRTIIVITTRSKAVWFRRHLRVSHLLSPSAWFLRPRWPRKNRNGM